jgi:hypothetical protein
MSLADISTLADYLKTHGHTLATKAIRSLSPLHVPGKHPLPDFSYIPEHRTPFDAQKHLIAGAVKMLDSNGAGFIIGEMGVGKTISAVIAVHEHAKRSRRQGGSGGKYRAIVICPDHLVSKWKNEIEDTIPGAVVHCWRPDNEEGSGITLNKWWDFLALMGLSLDFGGLKRWKKPRGAEWIVVGRDQIKRMPAWSGLGEPKKCFDGQIRKDHPSVSRVVDHKPVVDEDGYKKYDSNGYPIKKAVIDKRITCPKCGAIPTKKGIPLTSKDLSRNTQHRCKAMIFEQVGDPDGKGGDGLDRIVNRDTNDATMGRVPYELRNAREGSVVNHAGKKWKVKTCGEPLWQFVRKPNWWPAARIIQKKLRRIAQYLIVDEAHEQKSDSSAQSMAMGKILGTTRYCLGLTGTFIGGYASHLFPLMMRMASRDMTARGFEWGKEMSFVERYGCVDRIVRSEAPVESVVNKGNRSMRKAKLGNSSVTRQCRPGIMPTLFSQVVMNKAMFLKLEQFIDDLPGFEERMVACDLPAEIQAAYNETQAALSLANRDLIANGNMKLMGTMLWTLLSYPDHPWGWEPMFPAEGKMPPEHAVGWWRQPKVYTRDNFVGVCTPLNFSDHQILPKERKLIELCKANTEAGDQTWVYCELTQKRNVMPRLAKHMEAEGLRVGILKSGDVSPKEREEWIQKNGCNYDVMLSHPQLVATGLDLFAVAHGSHNFNHLVFYQTGYNLFRLRQASRRSWRIGQPKDCTVTYLYYSGTSQAAAIALMGRKAQAAQQLEEGTISDEGLAAMGGDSSAQMALVNALGEHIDASEIQRNWGRVKSGGRKPRQPKADEAADGAGRGREQRPGRQAALPPRATGLAGEATGEGDRRARKAGSALPVPAGLYDQERIPHPGVPSPLDSLPASAQVVAEAMVKVFEPEPEAEKPAVKPKMSEMSRDDLAALFDRMRAGTLEADEWDW